MKIYGKTAPIFWKSRYRLPSFPPAASRCLRHPAGATRASLPREASWTRPNDAPIRISAVKLPYIICASLMCPGSPFLSVLKAVASGGIKSLLDAASGSAVPPSRSAPALPAFSFANGRPNKIQKDFTFCCHPASALRIKECKSSIEGRSSPWKTC